MSNKKTTKQFIKEAQYIHGTKYDYSAIDYINSHVKININCKEHGIFIQMPYCHTNLKQGCPKCGVKLRSKNVIKTTKQFIKEAQYIHGTKYDYSDAKYIECRKLLIIICPIHGKFNQSPTTHLQGQGCKSCGYESNKIGTDTFVTKAIIIHNNYYDYSKVVYNRTDEKIIIGCPIHGFFQTTPAVHLRGSTCPTCANIKRNNWHISKGHKQIEQFLDDHQIIYEKEKIFPDCKSKKLLPYDFYIPIKNTLIEFDGKQHYQFVKIFHRTIDEFKDSQKRDLIKTNYAKNNNIVLIRIKWDETKLISTKLKILVKSKV